MTETNTSTSTNKNLWWGYRHKSGTYQVKRYYERLDIEEAKESEFCVFVSEPFYAEDRYDALRIVSNLYHANNYEELTEAEEQLYYWQMGTAGSFISALFQAVMCADMVNTAKLALAFPEHVKAAVKFQQEPGYWESVQRRMKKS